MAISLVFEDKQVLETNYPKLNCSLPRQVIWGTLEFCCSYDCSSKELIYSNSAPCLECISDSYEVRIDFNQFDTFGFPKVFEESDIIKSFSTKNAIRLDDLHLNEDDGHSCCLGIFPEYKWVSALNYIRDKVIPFFYWQSYKRMYEKEPWPAYSHGEKGILEAMTIPPDESSKGRSRNQKCPCGSGPKYKYCCLDRDQILKNKLPKPNAVKKMPHA